MFTENELENVVKERLRRDRRVNEQLLSVKKLLKEAGEKGIIEGSSYAEMAKSLEDLFLTRSDGGKIASSSCVTEQNTYCIPEQDGENDAETSGENDAGTGGKVKDDKENFFEILSRIKSKYPSADRLLSGEGLSKFAKGRSGSAQEIFDAYYDFMSCINEGVKGERKSHSDLSSTAFSSDASVSDTTFGLSRQQMEMAKSEGMSYREYANLLQAVPVRTRKTV